MSKSSYYNKSYRHQDVLADISRLEEDDEERSSILPPPAHASSSASFIPSASSPSRSPRKLPSDVSFLPAGINYSRESINFPKSSTDFYRTLKVSELPVAISSETISVAGRRHVPALNTCSKQQLFSSSGNIYSTSSSIVPNTAHSILSTSASLTAPNSDSYILGFTAPPLPSSPMLRHSSSPNTLQHNNFHKVSSIPTDLTLWDIMSRRTSSPPNNRSSVSPTYSTPPVSSQPFSFSPLPGITPPFSSSLLPLTPSNNLVSGAATTLSIGIVAPPPSAIFKHSINNNNSIAFGSTIQGSAALSSLLSNYSSNNSSPSNSRCTTPTNNSMSRSVTPPKTFMVPGFSVQNSKLNIVNTKRAHSKTMAMVPEIINIVTEEMVGGNAVSNKATSGTSLAPSAVESQSKYNQLLAVLQDMDKDIRPSYAGSKSSIERLKRGIVHSRVLIREALAEIERSSHRNNTEERQTVAKYPKLE